MQRQEKINLIIAKILILLTQNQNNYSKQLVDEVQELVNILNG
jgi:hypothetical protein